MMHWQTTLTVTQVVHDLVTKAGEQLRVNEVVRRSLVPYTVHREEDLLDNIVSQSNFQPTCIGLPGDSEARALGSDTLMGNP